MEKNQFAKQWYTMLNKPYNITRDKMKNKELDVLNYIKIIRQSFADAPIVYAFWACYWFYQILKERFPKAEWYKLNESHIITKIGWFFYDIDWEYALLNDDKHEKLTAKTHLEAESWKDWQRLERMLKKYNNQ